MNDKPKRGGWRLPVVLTVVLALPPLYVLSIGPASALAGAKVISFETWSTIYAPVRWACRKSETLEDWMVGYIRWWHG